MAEVTLVLMIHHLETQVKQTLVEELVAEDIVDLKVVLAVQDSLQLDINSSNI